MFSTLPARNDYIHLDHGAGARPPDAGCHVWNDAQSPEVAKRGRMRDRPNSARGKPAVASVGYGDGAVEVSRAGHCPASTPWPRRAADWQNKYNINNKLPIFFVHDRVCHITVINLIHECHGSHLATCRGRLPSQTDIMEKSCLISSFPPQSSRFWPHPQQLHSHRVAEKSASSGPRPCSPTARLFPNNSPITWAFPRRSSNRPEPAAACRSSAAA